MHSTQLGVVVLRGTTTSPMTQNITSRCALYIVPPSARTAGVDPTRGPTASGIGCAPRARVSEVTHGGLGRGSTAGLGPRNYAKNLAPPSCQEPRSNCVKRILPVGPMHSCVLSIVAVMQICIGVGNGARRPLPPNPLCGLPATGSPVSCFHIGIGAPIDGPRTS